MINQSMLAKDRRSESQLLLLMSLYVVAQITINYAWPVQLQVQSFLLWANLVVGGICALSVLIWCALRIHRLGNGRSFRFKTGMLIWLSLFLTATVWHLQLIIPLIFSGTLSWGFNLDPWVDPLTVFILFVSCCSLIAGLFKLQFCHELGWPIFKAVHWCYVVPVLLLVGSHVLNAGQVFAFFNFAVFLVYRYGYNRWIFASNVNYPFKQTAAKFYIKQLLR